MAADKVAFCTYDDKLQISSREQFRFVLVLAWMEYVSQQVCRNGMTGIL